MNNELSDYIISHGGKAGVLQYLYNHRPELREHLVPQQIIPYGQRITQKVFQQLIQSSKEYQSTEALLRLSTEKDRFGLVDYLPTEYIRRLPERSDHTEFDEYAKELLEKGLTSRNIPKYYKDKLQVILTPYIKHKLFTVTENPNQEHYLWIDTHKDGGIVGRIAEIANVFDSKILRSSGTLTERTVYEISRLVQKIRSTKDFDTTDRLQYEIGQTPTGHLYIFQIKKFANSFAPISKDLQKLLKPEQRVMGNIQLAQEKLYHHHSYKLDGLNELQQLPHQKVLFSCQFAQIGEESPQQHLQLETTPQNLQGFICEYHSALFHNLTGPTQAVLKNNGFAMLKILASSYSNGFVTMKKDKNGIIRSKSKNTNIFDQ